MNALTIGLISVGIVIAWISIANYIFTLWKSSDKRDK